MPVYQYEAMDNTGLEIKETIEAPSEAEAQQKIREKGFFVTRIQESGRKAKIKAAAKKKTGPRKRGTFTIGGVKSKHLCTFTRQLSTLQDAGLPILRSLRILEGQAKPGPLKNSVPKPFSMAALPTRADIGVFSFKLRQLSVKSNGGGRNWGPIDFRPRALSKGKPF